jgi:cysteinyl-tRNA synthetase, unknown class
LTATPLWTVYYGSANNLDIARVASTFKLIIIDADPNNGAPNFTAAQIAALKAHGAKVLSYLNLGACETARTYWRTVPSGFVSCGANTAAQISWYPGGASMWMNPSNAAYQNLFLNYLAPRLAATGIDGFMLDNFEIVGHGPNSTMAPCDSTCAQGGIDLVKKLRDKYPNLAIVPNAPPTTTISASSGGVSFPSMIDGVLTENVFLPSTNSYDLQMLQTWKSTEQNLGNRSFFVGALDYTSTCSATTAAQTSWTASTQAGFAPMISTTALDSICWWAFMP